MISRVFEEKHTLTCRRSPPHNRIITVEG